uniref:BTB domain-containing protein n=1 Tax=Strigamia maritima TaxID=126957 RepID=T1ISY7_STRMM
MERTMSLQAMNILNEMRRDGLLCDAIIRTDDGIQFVVHRAILSACSPYFRALFTSTLNIGERTNVMIPGISAEMLGLIIQYAYTRAVPITVYNVIDLLPAADQFHVLGLLKDCCDYLIEQLCPENCIGIRNFAKLHFCKEMEKESQNFIMRNFSEVAEHSEELMELPLQEVVAVFGADDLNVRNEDIVWEAVIRWIDEDPAARKQHIVVLMEQIRLGLLDTQYFIEKVKNHLYVQENDNCRPLVIETLKFLYDLEMITQKDGEVPTPELARPRVPHEIMFVIGGWSGGSPTNMIETYDTRADRWIKVPEVDPAGPRAYHGCAVIKFNIYVIGGFDGMDYFNSCRCFNAVSKEWREVAPMNARRYLLFIATTMFAL